MNKHNEELNVWDIFMKSIEKSGGVYEGMVVIRYHDVQNVDAKIKSDMEEI